MKSFVFDPDHAPTPACHAATIAVREDRLVVAWFGGTHEKHPDVGIWVARSPTPTPRTADWEPPRMVADGNGQACWNPVLADTDDGLLLFYKVGESPGTWHGEVLRSTDGGVSWGPGPVLPQGFLGPVKNKPVALAGGHLLCPSSLEAGGWRCHFERLDAAWLRGDPGPEPARFGVPDPVGLRGIQPALYRRQGGFEALVRTRAGVVARTTSPDGEVWSPLEATPLPNPNSGIDAAALPDGRVALVNNPAGIPEGRWGGARSPLVVSVSSAAGEWREAAVLEDGPGEFSYPAIVCAGGRVHVVYTWQRTGIRHVALDMEELA